MIDISQKKAGKRTAAAEGKISLGSAVICKIKNNEVPKGDVLKTSEVAGLLAVKKTPSLLPHCHPVKITKAVLCFNTGESDVAVRCEVEGIDRTGFEMEAITGAAVALITIYDMCKVFGYGMEIGEIRLVKKTGGKSAVKEKK